MRWELGGEVDALLWSLAEGAALAVLFDLFRFFRRPFVWKPWEVLLQDLLYWCLAAFFAFCFLLRSSDGVVRWYVLLGWTVGWIVWYESFGRLLWLLNNFLWNKAIGGFRILRKKWSAWVEKRRIALRQFRQKQHTAAEKKQQEKAAKRRKKMRQRKENAQKKAGKKQTGKHRKKDGGGHPRYKKGTGFVEKRKKRDKATAKRGNKP